ncbi:MAG: hypothetical protein GF417_00615 [Candidatus Latescibacteria bacterium]|nr:hypothetical protein [bacterium]MBD3422928.1 hypothetical protein [Candidatus Latescibacterota bacterium]
MSWRLIFLLIVLYFLYRSLKNIFFPSRNKRPTVKKPRNKDTFYDKITDQKIEDIDFEEVEPEDRE